MGQKSNQKRERRIQEGRQSALPADLPWTPFYHAVGKDGSHTLFDGTHEFRLFKNSRYTVALREVKTPPEVPGMIHLSIKRNDKKPVTSWRDVQAIKNELVGAECEGVQLFPAESRLVDNANQYHIYVCTDPEMRFPLGYDERLVSEGNVQGSVQEPFEDHVLPDDLIDRNVISRRMTEYKNGLRTTITE